MYIHRLLASSELPFCGHLLKVDGFIPCVKKSNEMLDQNQEFIGITIRNRNANKHIII